MAVCLRGCLRSHAVDSRVNARVLRMRASLCECAFVLLASESFRRRRRVLFFSSGWCPELNPCLELCPLSSPLLLSHILCDSAQPPISSSSLSFVSSYALPPLSIPPSGFFFLSEEGVVFAAFIFRRNCRGEVFYPFKKQKEKHPKQNLHLMGAVFWAGATYLTPKERSAIA